MEYMYLILDIKVITHEHNQYNIFLNVADDVFYALVLTKVVVMEINFLI